MIRARFLPLAGRRQPQYRRVLLLLSIAACMCFASASLARTERRPSVEYQVKASYLYNFLQFVEWPKEAFSGDHIVLCVFGENRFGSALAAATGETSRGRRIAVKHLATSEELESCHVVFLSSSERWREFQVLRALAGRPVLTIGETKGFTDRGGIINLIPVGNTIRFEINQRAAERNRLKVSAQLLQLAVRR